jgi:glycosyltransferase involved in cell wall biosynthesis
MISVVIPTLNSEEALARTLTSLVPAAVDGLVREVIVVDAGSTDRTLRIADSAGVEIVKAGGSRSERFAIGASLAKFPWLLFLRPDVEIEPGFERELTQLIDQIETGRIADTAAAFRFTLDDRGAAPQLLEVLAGTAFAVFRIPSSSHGLFISRQLYDAVGRYASVPAMENADIARRLGRRRITALRSRVIASPARFRREGYGRAMARGILGTLLYACRVPIPRIAKLYGEERASS